ncbi:hypothetical protein B0T22DRAFT_496266 [Podospora appendiculata]|uniref:Uncharacterized protein n=1 Tax=Podospora appendiculata TaxID=314037 RepID=A0AAE0XHT2_9PEZI|nr:hypothetical protein B0T22DRAFT_496266 [Podospora appendiculata]
MRPRLNSTPYIHPPDVFGRPLSPAPPPLVYINGWPGVGKEAVAECLSLLLGVDKSLLVDVRGIGHDYHDDDHPLTPEHPGYFDLAHTSPDTSPSSPPSTPCSDNLARLLHHRHNLSRIAILAAHAPNTPAGRETVRVFEATATRAGRLFIPVALTCEPAEHMRRASSLQRQCSHKTRTQPAAGTAERTVAAKTGRQQALALFGDELTVDVTHTSAFEAALQIVEVVKTLVVERDVQLCYTSRSAGSDKASPLWATHT